MFLCQTQEPADVDSCDAVTNQALGRDLKNALRQYGNTTEVFFLFNYQEYRQLKGTETYCLD